MYMMVIDIYLIIICIFRFLYLETIMCPGLNIFILELAVIFMNGAQGYRASDTLRYTIQMNLILAQQFPLVPYILILQSYTVFKFIQHYLIQQVVGV